LSIRTRKRLSAISLTDPRHLMRHLKAQAIGGTPHEAAVAIAKAEGVSVDTVKKSINQVDMYYKSNSAVRMDVGVRELVIAATAISKESLSGLLMATELVEVPNPKTGKKKIVEREDKTTRLEANRLVKDLIVAVTPKGPLIENNINQTNQVANLTSGVETNEERMRRLRKQAQEHNLLPPEVKGVPASIDSGIEEEDDDEEGGDDDEENE
jgi:hypothetical protein